MPVVRLQLSECCLLRADRTVEFKVPFRVQSNDAMQIYTLLQKTVTVDKAVRLFIGAYGRVQTRDPPRAFLDILVDACS